MSIEQNKITILQTSAINAVKGAFRPKVRKRSTSPSVRLSIKEQMFFIKRLSFLIRANVPMLESLHMLREQTKSKKYSLILDALIADVANGQYLSSSLRKFKKTFGEFSINIIHIGETSGVLSENLDYLADELKKRHTLKRKVASAFVYPAIVTAATLGITAFLMVYLFPKITPVFASLNTELPLSTKMVIFLSNMVRNHGLFILGIFIAIVIAIVLTYKKSHDFQFIVDKSLLKIPVIGKMFQSYNLANLSRTLGILLKSGVTLSEGLPITSRTIQNLVYKKEFDGLQKCVNRGEKISTYFKENELHFPQIMSQIIAVGERSGNLQESFVYISELYEAEVDDFTKNLSNLIEPALMIIMGLLVGFIAISIITPIYSITQNLHA